MNLKLWTEFHLTPLNRYLRPQLSFISEETLIMSSVTCCSPLEMLSNPVNLPCGTNCWRDFNILGGGYFNFVLFIIIVIIIFNIIIIRVIIVIVIIILIIIVIIIRSKFFFLFIGREPTTWPANNCLQIMVCSCAMLSISVWLQIIFCSCVKETVLFSFLRSLLRENSRSLRFPRIFIKKKQTRWSNDKTITELGYRKIWWFVSVSQINYFHILMQIKCGKILHLPSFWKWELLQLLGKRKRVDSRQSILHLALPHEIRRLQITPPPPPSSPF